MKCPVGDMKSRIMGWANNAAYMERGEINKQNCLKH
jgi:hypothetical protein